MSASAKVVLAVLASLLPGCKDDTPEPGELLVTAMIGPEGGQLAGAGITLDVPPGAVSTETEFQLLAAGGNLSASSYRQSGTAYELRPQGLELALPAKLTFSDGPSTPAVLFKQDGITVAGDGLSTYINELGLVAVASAGVRLVNVVEPIFAPTPEAATTVIHDAVHFELQVTDTSLIDVVLTFYDFENLHMHDLNGAASKGDCGLQIDGGSLLGASLSAGCTPLTNQLRVNTATVKFDAVPYQSGNVNPAVPVAAIVGGADLAYFQGFFRFDTSPCYEENCQNRGTCMVDASGAGACVCDEGYAVDPDDPFRCNCVPQCDGRECGDDRCGGQCGFCGDNEFCTDGGRCQEFDEPDTTGDVTTSDTGDDTMGTMDTGDGSTTMDPTGTGTGTTTG